MNTYKDQIKQIVENITIHSTDQYSVYGKKQSVKYQIPHQTFSGNLNSFGSHKVVDKKQKIQNLTNAITGSIYGLFYCGISIDQDSNTIPSKVEREEFMDKLSVSNTTKGGYDYNWTIYNIDSSGNTFVKKGEELRWLQPNSYYFQNPHQKTPGLNTKVNLIKTRDSRNTQPVFYHVFSDEIFPQEAELCRFYWNIKPEGIKDLIHALTSTLNEYKIAFQFKCLNHPDLYVRTDAAVLYIDKRYVQIVSVILKSVITEVQSILKDEVPMFTKKLFNGVGFAEDPGKGMGFGMSRATIIGEAIVNSYLYDENKKNTYEYVVDCLQEKGIATDQMHLNEHTALTTNFPTYE